MKKIIKYILLWFFLLWINQTYAELVSFENPIWNDISYKPEFLWPSNMYLLYNILADEWEIVATQFCIQNSWTYVSSNYYQDTNEVSWITFNWIWQNISWYYIYDLIICDINSWNNIYEIVDKQDWINKKIFTKEELSQIFQFELAVLLFLLSYVYSVKLIDLDKSKITNFIFFKKWKWKN